ncbi:DUF982 domain-containing protein [Phyllobacterium brassicacearum]
MHDVYFDDVTIESEKIGRLTTINSVVQAAAYLLQSWPIDSGKELFAARRACLACLEGKLSAGATRAAFIDATLEAGIHIIPFVRSPSTGKPQAWRKRRPKRHAWPIPGQSGHAR